MKNPPAFALKTSLAAFWLAACAGHGLAQTSTWTGTGGNANFSTAGNWDTLPVTPGATDTNLTFQGSNNTGTVGSPLLQDVTNSYRVSNMTFAANAGPFVIGGSTSSRTFNFRNNPVLQNLSTTSRQTLLLDVTLTNGMLVTGASTDAPIELAGAITRAGSGNPSLTLGSSTTYLILSGNNANFAGTGRLRMNAGGILGINNDNALLSNPTSIAQQSLEITSLADGARLRAETTDRTVANGIDASADFILEGQHNLTFSGSAVLNTTPGALSVTVNAGRTLTFNGNTAQTGTPAAVSKLGAGRLVIGDSRTDQLLGFSSGLIVSEGTLLINATGANTGTISVGAGAELGGAGSLALADNASILVSGALTAGAEGEGTMSLTLAGTGKVAFGADSVYRIELGGANDGLVAFDTTGDWLSIADGATLDIIDGGALQTGVWYTLFSGVSTAPSTNYAFAGGAEGIFRLDGGNYQVQLVPEPQALVLLLLGTLACLTFRKHPAAARGLG